MFFQINKINLKIRLERIVASIYLKLAETADCKSKCLLHLKYAE